MPRLVPKRRSDPPMKGPAPAPLPVVHYVRVTKDFTYGGITYRTGTNQMPTAELLELCAHYPEHLRLTSLAQLDRERTS